VAAWSEVWVCGRLPVEIVCLISAGRWMFVSWECCIAGRDLCDELITRLEESSLMSVCVCVSDRETSIMMGP